MERTSIQDLEAVMAVARRGSFRAAAVDMAMSTTALSHAVGKVEAQLGIRLFNRTTRSVSLTDAGRVFVERISPALRELDAGFEAVRSQRDAPSGTIRINAAPFAAREIITPLVLDFLARHPEMTVEIAADGRLVDIVEGGFDLGVRVAHLVPQDMIAVSLGRPQRYAVVGSPAYLAERPPPAMPTDLHHHRCIRVRLPDGTMYPWLFQKDGEALRIDVPGNLVLDEASVSRAAVIAGAGLGYFMAQDVRADLASGRLVQVLAEWTAPTDGLCVYYPGRRNLSAGMKAFLQMVREQSAPGAVDSAAPA